MAALASQDDKTNHSFKIRRKPKSLQRSFTFITRDMSSVATNMNSITKTKRQLDSHMKSVDKKQISYTKHANDEGVIWNICAVLIE